MVRIGNHRLGSGNGERLYYDEIVNFVLDHYGEAAQSGIHMDWRNFRWIFSLKNSDGMPYFHAFSFGDSKVKVEGFRILGIAVSISESGE